MGGENGKAFIDQRGDTRMKGMDFLFWTMGKHGGILYPVSLVHSQN